MAVGCPRSVAAHRRARGHDQVAPEWDGAREKVKPTGYEKETRARACPLSACGPRVFRMRVDVVEWVVIGERRKWAGQRRRSDQLRPESGKPEGMGLR